MNFIKTKRSYFNLEVTLQKAIQGLAAKEPEAVARFAGVVYTAGSPGYFELPFLHETYRVAFPDGAVYNRRGDKESIYLSIILLHYLIQADGTPLAGEWVSFRHLPGGQIYTGPFQQRAVMPFLKAFGDRPQAFREAAAGLGGFNASLGDVSMVIPVLPRVPLAFALWLGDEEFPPSANILFDAQAGSYLPTEDYAHLAGMIVKTMSDFLDSRQD